MEAQIDIQTYLEQGRQALAQGRPREAAIAYAHGAQIESDNPQIHLGLAEANLGLGSYGVVQMACRRVQELQPSGGLESRLAQALLDLLDRRYERALQNTDAVISENPGIPYAHALRAHLLRAMGQTYDANLARARAARSSFGGRFENCFPTIEPLTPPEPKLNGQSASPAQIMGNGARERDAVPSWSRPNPFQRRMIRTRFTLGQMPGIITYIIIALNFVAFLLVKFAASLFLSLIDTPAWYIVSIFVTSDIISLLLGAFTLFFVGRAIEVIYGKWRYIVIYLASGIIGGLVSTYIVGGATTGMSYAMFGIFGALGTFYFVNRRAMGGFGQGAFQQWLIFAALYVALSIIPSLGGQSGFPWGLIASLIGGMLVAFLVAPRQRRNMF
ncbi:rhomboid family intramembrane serine protease [Ktedonospora formicarum]|uniref:Peptidase S54 rhomboid domain-containing protein n=1 Tax=Ktedonospora formicarum TaxID=2778364 RepID=A0A8J3MR50_9CHLR|nr:rhomboid family intramembrane serine protease [Ktedonospora formicarum]GHO43436.1 hypothetical protein KSX_15990 [Ktedonospora formicarum]